MRTSSTVLSFVRLGRLAAIALPAFVLTLSAQQPVKVELPDSLAAQAKITETVARQRAQRKVPSGQIVAVELEREHGRLQYSYDMKVAGRSGVTEVNVDAVTGAIIGVQHEGAATEASERAQEAKERAAKVKP